MGERVKEGKRERNQSVCVESDGWWLVGVVPVPEYSPRCRVVGSSLLPAVLACTKRSLCDRGLIGMIIGSKGSSSSKSLCHISEEGRAGWCLTLNKVVLGGRVLLG